MSHTNGQSNGHRLADLLGITVIGVEGHDLRCPCVKCASSDAGRIHHESGVYYCYSCKTGMSAYDLCLHLLVDRERTT